MLSPRTQNDFDNMSVLLKKIDEYELEDKGVLLTSNACTDRVEQILGEKGVNALYDGADLRGGKNKEHRTLFLEYLHRRLSENALPKKDDASASETVTLEKFLGSEGLTLFRKALAEEYKSPHFRNAVFLKSVKPYPGPKWKKRLMLWIGGPSASGKTHATHAAIEAVSKQLAGDSQDPSPNLVVSVDGGIEREMSQMNQMVLQLALSKGYKGIQDLHADGLIARIRGQSKLKKNVKKAALTTSDLSLAVPNTFTSGKLTGQTKKQIKRFNEMPDCVQVFSEVMTDKESVFRNGESRAWGEYNGKIVMNNREIGCDSKEFKKSSFEKGKKATAEAKEIYLEYSNDPICLTIVNDLVYVKVTAEKDLVKCTPDDPDSVAVKTTKRALDAWHALNPKPEDPIQWLASCQQQADLKKLYFSPIINRDADVVPVLETPPLKKIASENSNEDLNRVRSDSESVLLQHSLPDEKQPTRYPLNTREHPVFLAGTPHKPPDHAFDFMERKTGAKTKKIDKQQMQKIQTTFLQIGSKQKFNWTVQAISPSSFNIYENNKSIFGATLSPKDVNYRFSSKTSDKHRQAFLQGTLLNQHHPLTIYKGGPKTITGLLEEAIKLLKAGNKVNMIVSGALLKTFTPEAQAKIKTLMEEEKSLIETQKSRPVKTPKLT
jgi:hypothetical protein